MTTNAYDKNTRMLASDSRWSFRLATDGIPSTEFLCFIDNTGFDKIAVSADSAYMFAGPGHLIDQWKKWATHPQHLTLQRPPVATNFAVCGVDRAAGEVWFEHGQKVNDLNGRFAGTGASFAYECWAKNSDIRKSITSAMSGDILSGGDVKFFCCNTNDNNLQDQVEFSAIKDLFLKKGMVMYISTGTGQNIVPVQEAANTDPRVKEFVQDVLKNHAQAEAPSGYDPVVWTPQDELRLDQAIAARRAALRC